MQMHTDRDQSPRLEARILGGCALRFEDRDLPETVFRRRRSLTLLLYLLSLPQHRAPREQVLEMLWPDSDPEESERGLRVVLSDLRAALAADQPVVSGRGPTIGLHPDLHATIDADAFEIAARKASRSVDRDVLQEALALYRGPYLPDRQESWALARREHLARQHEQLLSRLAQIEEEANPISAEGRLRALFGADPADEATARRLMDLLERLGRPAEAFGIYDTVKAALHATARLTPGPETERLRARLIHSAGQAAVAPAATAGVRRRTNMPVPITSFVGREWELTELRSLLLGPPAGHRLLTLSGPGGCGKTRLALESGTMLLPHYRDGVWLAEFAPLVDERLIPRTVATALGLRESRQQANAQDMRDLLIETLREQHALLLLDTCEHVRGAVTDLAAVLLHHCPALSLLATSREALGLAEETVWLVPSLTVPSQSRPQGEAQPSQSTAQMKQFSAVRLFVERAQASRPDFVLSDVNAPAIGRICAELDGIPLAIELAAAQLRAMAVEDLVARLHDRFRLLASGNRAALPRQRTLQAMMDWSYALLDERERLVLQRLAVFAGGWTLEAAAAVCASDAVPAATVAQQIAQLVAKSLAYTDGGRQEPAPVPRYRMLETVRQYARERLDAAHWEALQRIHAAYFLAMAERAEPELTGPDQGVWLARLEEEHANIRAALSWLCASREQAAPPLPADEAGDPESDRAALGLRLAGALWRFWLVHGHLSEGSAWLEAVLSRGAHLAAPLKAKAYNGAGNLAWAMGNYEQAIAFHSANLALWRETGNRHGMAAALRNLGNVAGDQGDYERAATLHGESLTLSREVGSAADIASALSNLGNVRKEQGHYTEAQALYEESLVLRRQVGDRRGIGLSLANLGNVLRYQGDNETARRIYEESLVLRREIGDKRGIVVVLTNLGRIARDRGDTDGAAPFYAESLALAQIVGDRMRLAECLEGIGGLAYQRKHPEHALRLLAAAATMREAIGAPLPPNEQETVGREIAELRAVLGNAAATEAEALGRSMTAAQAIQIATEECTARGVDAAGQ